MAIYEEVTNRGQAGTWHEKSKELLQRVFGFELLMAPYVVSHLKIGLLMQELNSPLSPNERLQIYLTNTLEEGVNRSQMLDSLGYYIAEESSEAARIKKQENIMVVLGNPPYSNFGEMNKNDWILGLLDDYKKGLHEKKINLDDDYIKFIRFGQWMIDKTGQGILSFITNNSFLDGITHRRMRQSLMESFSDIYILNLHGNSNVQENPPIGVIDKNIFDIQQGVSINIFIKKPNNSDMARIHYRDLWGTREEKYDFLTNNDIFSIKWTDIKNIDRESCLGKFWFYTPVAFTNIDEYCCGWSVNDIFVVKQNALKTDRDKLVFDFDQKKLAERMQLFYSGDGLKSPFKELYNISNSSSLDLLGKRLKTTFDPKNISRCLYRPFDVRWLYYSNTFTSRPAWDVMRHMSSGNNIALLAKRQSKRRPFSYILCANLLVESCVFESANANNSVFPLYRYTTPDDTKGTLFSQNETFYQHNFSPTFIKEFSKKLRMQFIEKENGDLINTFGPLDIFYYAYALFYSPTYRSRYAEFLKIDFPRLQLTSNKKLFAKLVAKGEELVSLHLLKSTKVDNFITTYPVMGNNSIEKVQYANGNVWINSTQYFGSVPKSIYEFNIGGYQVCEKWLMYRKGRTLSGEDITHYQRVVVALNETIRLMKAIDEYIPGWPIK